LPPNPEFGSVIAWSGSIGSIPADWTLCDGNHGAPDLRNMFIPGAGSTYNPGSTGGAVAHDHTFVSSGHNHSLLSAPNVETGASFSYVTGSEQLTGTTDSGSTLSPYYALCYIMYIGGD
jgi:hypothetical protein